MIKKYKNLLCLSGIGCAVSGLALLFIPAVNIDGTGVQRFFAVILAALFWLGLVTEIGFFVLADKQCKIIEERLIAKGSINYKDKKIGIISFFTCREAMAADILAAISLIIMILMIVLKVTNDWAFMIIAVLFFFSFNLHCFLNGRNYKYLKAILNFNKKQGAKKDE